MTTRFASEDVMVHETAIVETRHVGPRSRVWAFAHVMPEAQIGADANICDHVFIENDVVIGDRVTVKCGVQLWDGLRVEDDVFIGPNAAFTNDAFPRSKAHLSDFPRTTLCRGCSIGAGAVILAGISVGTHAMVGAGAVVTRNIPPYAIARGNPARIEGYVDATAPMVPEPTGDGSLPDLGAVQGARMVAVPTVTDIRGTISAAEVMAQVPFTPFRTFVVHSVPSKEVRGEHAHHTLEQFLICVSGSVNVVVDDGKNRAEVVLDTPAQGLYVPPLVWATQYRYSDAAVLLVLASAPYDPADYIRDYAEFTSLMMRTAAAPIPR